MTYSIIGTGRHHKGQAVQAIANLTQQERQRELTEDQLEAAEERATSQSMGAMAGIGFGEDINRYYDDLGTMNERAAVMSPTEKAAVDQAAAQTGTMQPIMDPSVVDAGATAATEEAAAVAAEGAVTEAATQAAAAETAAAVTAAEATAATGASAGAGAGAATGAEAGATFGPWGALAGLAIGYLVPKLF